MNEKAMAHLKVHRNVVLLHKVRHRTQLTQRACYVERRRRVVSGAWLDRISAFVDCRIDGCFRLQEHEY
jgi:hypothetical protein